MDSEKSPSKIGNCGGGFQSFRINGSLQRKNWIGGGSMIRVRARVKVNLFLILNFMHNVLPSISAWQRASVGSNCGINTLVPEK